MLLFKTSNQTLENVINNKKHALHHQPKQWEKGEVLLLSKNRKGSKKGEKQIQYIMTLDSIVMRSDEIIKKYWPESRNDWNYLIICSNIKKLDKAFDLVDILGERANPYHPAQKPKKILKEDEKKIMNFINKSNGS